jgi:hypothetical protein
VATSPPGSAATSWPSCCPAPTSMGVASSAVSGADPEALLAAVDSQLYLAEQTRNAVRAPAVPAG